jgi:putative ABC transport system substrate-binding protein
MRRRDFVLGLGGTAACAFASPSPSAQPLGDSDKVRRVGVLILGADNDPVAEVRASALREGLNMLGWVEGGNLRLDYRFGAADPNRLRAYAKELVGLNPDVIVTGAAPATKAVQQLTQTIPIVFVEVTNSAAYGLNENLVRPDANSTGITNIYLAIGARWVELLKQAAPRTRKIAVLFNPEFDSRGYMGAIEAAATTYVVKVIRTPVRNSEDIKRALRSLSTDSRSALLMVPPTPAFNEVELIFRLAEQYRLPAIYPTRGFPAAGGLMAFGTDSAELFRNAATYVDRILHGAKPSDLMIEFPTKFDLVINRKAAKAIGLEFPQGLVARAAEVIE